MISNEERLDILQNLLSNLEEATCFSFVEYINHEGFEIDSLEQINEIPLDYVISAIETIEANSDQLATEFLKGEGYSSEEISQILSC